MAATFGFHLAKHRQCCHQTTGHRQTAYLWKKTLCWLDKTTVPG